MSKDEFLEEKANIGIRDWIFSQTFEWKEIISKYDLNFDSLGYIKKIIKNENKTNLENTLDDSIDYIRNLPPNWDDNDALKFKEETIRRASELVREICYQIWEAEIEISPPKIQPVPDGSIDINWELDKFELLINIPDDIDKSVNLYGEYLGHPEDEIANRMNYTLVLEMVISWLKKIHALIK